MGDDVRILAAGTLPMCSNGWPGFTAPALGFTAGAVILQWVALTEEAGHEGEPGRNS